MSSPTVGHSCDYPFDRLAPGVPPEGTGAWGYGAAIDGCWEDEGGLLWVANSEYASPVNFCPICGYAAPTPALLEEEESRS